MKNVTVKLKFDPKKYTAVCQFMEEKGLDIEAELSEEVNRRYQKHVPAAVRKYIEGTAASASVRHCGASEGPTMHGENAPTLGPKSETSPSLGSGEGKSA